MSFIADLFGGPTPPPPPTPSPATPTISDAASESAAREEASRAGAKYGADKTILTSGLGDSSGVSSDVNRTKALGGNSSLTSPS